MSWSWIILFVALCLIAVLGFSALLVELGVYIRRKWTMRNGPYRRD